MWSDIINFIRAWLYEGFAYHPRNFQFSLIAAFILTVILWVAGLYYPYLFNRRFRPRWSIQAACAAASAPSLVILLILFCSSHAPAALGKEIDLWATQLAQGANPETAQWHYERAAETYYAVKSLNNGDLAGVAPPTTGGASLLLTKPESFEAMARIYSTSAVANFIKTHPYLARILTVDPLECEVALTQRFRQTLQPRASRSSQTASISAREAVEYAASVLKSGIQGSGGFNAQLWRAVIVLRLVLALAFLAIQLIPFTWNGWVAYQDIQIPATATY